jgi:hypothetical protein
MTGSHPRSFTFNSGTFYRSSRFLPLGVLLCTLFVLPGLSVAGSPRSGQAKAEKPYALLFGTVWGPDDHPLYGVKVKIRRPEDKKARWEVYSNHRGEFEQRLPPGKADYLVWADLKGYKCPDGKKLQPGEAVKVHFENDERLDTGLHLKW